MITKQNVIQTLDMALESYRDGGEQPSISWRKMILVRLS